MLNKIIRAYLLADTGKSLKFKTSVKRSVITLSAHEPDILNTVVVVEFKGEPITSPSLVYGKKITASSQGAAPSNVNNLLDGNRLTGWTAKKEQEMHH